MNEIVEGLFGCICGFQPNKYHDFDNSNEDSDEEWEGPYKLSDVVDRASEIFESVDVPKHKEWCTAPGSKHTSLRANISEIVWEAQCHDPPGLCILCIRQELHKIHTGHLTR